MICPLKVKSETFSVSVSLGSNLCKCFLDFVLFFSLWVI